MRRIVLEAGKMADTATLHMHLAEALALPDHYGANLDALYDCLTELGEDIEIAVPVEVASEELLGSYGRQLLRVFKDAAEANACLRVEFTEAKPGALLR